MHNQHRSPDPTKIERATATSTVALFFIFYFREAEVGHLYKVFVPLTSKHARAGYHDLRPMPQEVPSEFVSPWNNSDALDRLPSRDPSHPAVTFTNGGAPLDSMLRNANMQLRPEPPNPRVIVSPFNQSTRV